MCDTATCGAMTIETIGRSVASAAPVYISRTAKKTGCGIAGDKGFDIVNICSNRVDCGKCYR